jgi:hypothetical protein
MRRAVIVMAVLCLCGAQKAHGQEPNQGELKLEGKCIKKLVLEREGGEKVRFDRPGESIKVPVGRYILREVHLEGGYDCYIYQTRDEDWITVDANKPATLKAGAPLKQVIKAQRRGRLLELDYELVGIGGEKYRVADRSKPPTFNVYKGDQKIGSGEFEYG